MLRTVGLGSNNLGICGQIMWSADGESGRTRAPLNYLKTHLAQLFSFYLIAPISINFLYNYQITDAIQNNFTLESHIGLVTNMIIGVSALFELPVVIYFLAKIGLITPAILKKYRKHALVFVLIIAAIITPPDVASQIIVSIPVLILYEISIKVAAIVIKRQQKNAK